MYVSRLYFVAIFWGYLAKWCVNPDLNKSLISYYKIFGDQTTLISWPRGHLLNQTPFFKFNSILWAIFTKNHDFKGDKIVFGSECLHALATPGHTDGCMSFVSRTAKIVFTGDALLIRGCGRTDFQQGSSERLYDSIHKKILTLGDEYTVFPGHDYNGIY